jgi:hypothetical protein
LEYFVIFDKLPKVNKRPLGENSPNLVTLMHSTLAPCLINPIEPD